jgi:Na+/H+ antiporter NhaD/arsenite permease-like protein
MFLMQEYLPIISIVSLVLAVIIGFTKKINMGFLAFPISLILGKLGGISDGALISGFGTSTFVMLLGVTFLFSIAQNNQTLDLIAKKTIALAGKNTWMIPILILILSVVLAAIGPGNIPVGLLLCAFSASLALELKINPLTISTFAILGANAGCMSPFANGGIIAINLGAEVGQEEFVIPLFLNNIIPAFLFGILVYLFYKGYKIKAGNPLKLQDLPRFSNEQKITLIGMGALIVATAILGFNVGLAAFFIAIALLLCGIGSQQKAIAGIPWPTLILVCGMSVLMKVVVTLGGIKMISETLASIMNAKTASPIMALSAGIMSWFSSTTGVVMPTLIPTLIPLVENFGSAVTFTELISSVVSTSFAAALSPVSTGGAMVLASYVAASQIDADKQNKMFRDLFLLSVVAVLFNVFLGALGFFRIL